MEQGDAPTKIILFPWGFCPKPNIVSQRAGLDQAEECLFSAGSKLRGQHSLLVSLWITIQSIGEEKWLYRKHIKNKKESRDFHLEDLGKGVGGWEGCALLIRGCPDPSGLTHLILGGPEFPWVQPRPVWLRHSIHKEMVKKRTSIFSKETP